MSHWLNAGTATPIFGVLGSRKPEAYRCTIPGLKQPVFILGPYDAACGGCDAIQPYKLIPELLVKYAQRGHVLFEGMLVGHSYGSVGKVLDELCGDGHHVVIVFLTTSLKQCLANVQKRRDERGETKEFDPKNLLGDYRNVERMRRSWPEESKAELLDLASGDVYATLHSRMKMSEKKLRRAG